MLRGLRARGNERAESGKYKPKINSRPSRRFGEGMETKNTLQHSTL